MFSSARKTIFKARKKLISLTIKKIFLDTKKINLKKSVSVNMFTGQEKSSPKMHFKGNGTITFPAERIS